MTALSTYSIKIKLLSENANKYKSLNSKDRKYRVGLTNTILTNKGKEVFRCPTTCTSL